MFVRAVLKYAFASYACSLLIVAVHFPKTFVTVLQQKPLAAGVLPIFAPTVVRSYVQVLTSRHWPWSADDDLITLEEVFAAYAVKPSSPSGPELYFNAQAADWEYGLDYQMREESFSYVYARRDAPYPHLQGMIVQAGRYICLSNTSQTSYIEPIFGTQRCFGFLIIANKIYWRELGMGRRFELQFR